MSAPRTVAEIQAANAATAAVASATLAGLPGVLNISKSDATLVVTIVDAKNLPNKKMIGAQDVSFTVEGMMQDKYKGPTLVRCCFEFTILD